MPGIKYKAKGGAKYKAKKGTKLGMQSVKYGLDNNPGVTAADPKAKFIAKDKKQAKKGMKAENGLKPIVKTKKNRLTGRTKTKTITRNPDGTTTRSKVKSNRFGEVTKQKSKTTGAGDFKTKKKYTKTSGKTVTQTKGRATPKSIAKGAGDILKTIVAGYAALPGVVGTIGAGAIGANKLADKIVTGTVGAMDKNLKGVGTLGQFRKKSKGEGARKTEEGNTFMMGGRVNYPGKVSPDSNYDMLNKQQS